MGGFVKRMHLSIKDTIWFLEGFLRDQTHVAINFYTRYFPNKKILFIPSVFLYEKNGFAG